MVKVMYNNQLVYKVVIWSFFGISLWKEKVALNFTAISHNAFITATWNPGVMLTPFMSLFKVLQDGKTKILLYFF